MTGKLQQQAENQVNWLNEIMEKIGSEHRFGIEYPWSMNFLALKDKNKPNCWIHTFMSIDGYRKIKDSCDMLREVLMYLQSEGLLKK
jgi:hypothetical protein